MKILVICQYYYPEPFRITDICEELAKRGHEVFVVTGEPNYPEGIIYSEYKKHDRMDELINGVRVHRCRIIPRKKGPIFRFLNYYSFVFSSLKYVNSKACCSLEGSPFDVVFVNQLSPVMMAYAGIKYKKRMRKKVLLYCLDLWPESLVAGGIKRNSLVYKVFHIISNSIYRRVDKILVTSKSFEDYFSHEFGISNTSYLPQYAEDLFSPEACKKTPNGVLDLMFAGNIGSAQSIDTVIEAAKKTNNYNVHWHIVGDGSELQRLKELARDLSNITFYGRQPIEKMPEFYSKADIMVVSMKKDPFISLTLPGKIQTYMAAGKPIIGAIDGETEMVIKDANCGLCGAAEDSDMLAYNVKSILSNANIDEYASNSIDYYNRHFSKNAFFKGIEKELLVCSE